MNTATYKIPLSFDQILMLVRQLPTKEKTELGRVIANEVIDQKLTKLLKLFKTDQLSDEIITSEVEKIRAAIYAKSQVHKNNR